MLANGFSIRIAGKATERKENAFGFGRTKLDELSTTRCAFEAV